MSRFEYIIERFADHLHEDEWNDRLALLVHEGWQVSHVTASTDGTRVMLFRFCDEEPTLLVRALKRRLHRRLSGYSDSFEPSARASLILDAAGANDAMTAADMAAVEQRVEKLEQLSREELQAIIAKRGAE